MYHTKNEKSSVMEHFKQLPPEKQKTSAIFSTTVIDIFTLDGTISMKRSGPEPEPGAKSIEDCRYD